MLSVLIPQAFLAGLLTFLAPCTLPLVPGYLGFISGVASADHLVVNGRQNFRWRVIINGLMFVLGFSLVFILLGSLAGWLGFSVGPYRSVLGRVGGLFVIIFGLYMVGAVRWPWLNSTLRFPVAKIIKPGHPLSSLVFGTAFGFGWTPCVGPILGTILFLASSTATAAEGAMLLAIYSLGLAVPFLLVALTFNHAIRYIKAVNKYLETVSFIGGLFLIFLGLLLLTNNFNWWLAQAYRWLQFINYNSLWDHL